jgi:pimeloyl-ACP methyl ester carboxylesterase
VTVAVRQTEIRLHGHRLCYRTGGRGPVLLLIHGITNSSASWDPVFAQLATRFTVIAPDLLGHGQSAKPRGDYSLGASASLMRDLMVALGHERATIVGHSLGGGIAMQMAYQFPERVERLALVSSGGLGRQVTPMLRAVALPAAEYVLPLLASPPLVSVGAKLGGWIQRVGLRVGADITAMASGVASLQDIEARRAFVHTARSVMDFGGQRINAFDRLYLSQAVPTLLVWGDRDPVIPVRHAIRAHEEMPGSRLKIFAGAKHFPHHDDPGAFSELLRDFVETTEPAEPDDGRLRRLVLERIARDQQTAVAELDALDEAV